MLHNGLGVCNSHQAISAARSNLTNITLLNHGEGPMDPQHIANEIRRVIKGELDDCERAINANNKKLALNELDDAMRKLKLLSDQLMA